MSTRWLIALVSVLVLLAGACEGGQDGESADLGTQDDTEEQTDDSAQQRLDDAVATTMDEGSAEFTAAIGDTGGAAGLGSDTGVEDNGTDDTVTDDAESADEGGETGTDGEMSGEAGTEDDGSTDAGAGTNGMTDDAAQTGPPQIEGSVDFDEELRRMELSSAEAPEGMSATAILDQNDLYVQHEGLDPSAAGTATGDAADDNTGEDEGAEGDGAGEGTDGDAANAQWAHVNVHELVEAEPGASQLLLHDPSPVLQALQNATVDVREGPAADDGTSATDDGMTDDAGNAEEGGTDDEDGTSLESDVTEDGEQADKADLIATVDTTESDQPALEALAEQTGATDLDVKVWVETATATNGTDEDGGGDNGEGDERISQLAITVPAGAADGLGAADDENGAADDENGAADESAEGEVGVEDEATPGASAIGQDRELTVELTNFGTDVNIEVPEDDQVVEVEAKELRRLFSDRAQGTEPTPTLTPTPDAEEGGDDSTTDS